MFTKAVFAGALCFAAAAGASDILPGNLITNGDFEEGQKGFTSHLHAGTAGGVDKSEGMESRSMLTIKVPVKLKDTENYFSQWVNTPPAPVCRSYRVTFWLRNKTLSDRDNSGAGVRAVFFDAAGNERGRVQHFFKRDEKINEWQIIDRIRDGWWDNEQFEFTLPAGTVKFRLDCGIFHGAGKADIDRVIVSYQPTVKEMLAETTPVKLKITDEVVKKELSELHFTTNADYRHSGIYFGTLPESDPRSQRGEFAAALRKAGIKVIRFPGGMPTHHYFISGETASKQYFKKFKGGSPNPYGYPEIGNVIDFCRTYGFELLFETNTMFFTAKDGNVYPITDNFRVKNFPEFRGKERIAEAAAELDAFLSKLPPGTIRYWEIGNEDFALMSCDDYAAIAAAFTKVIKKHVPDATILVTGNSWTAELCKKLDKHGVIKDISALTAHYPWGDHWEPAGDIYDMRRMVCGRSNWAINTNAHMKMIRNAGYDHLKMSGSETSTFKFHTWDAFNAITSPAQGLLFASNWIEAMNIGDLTSLAFHDMDSAYFGMILTRAYFCPELRGYRSIPPDGKIPATHLPTRIVHRDYIVHPCGEAQNILARHVGMDVLKADTVTDTPEKNFLFSSFVTRKDNRLLFTLVHRGEKPRKVTVNYPAVKSQTAVGSGISWKAYEGVDTPSDPFEVRRNFKNGTLDLTLRPRSITQFEVKL